MYWFKVLHATSDLAELSCHAMLTRRESGGKLPACLDLRFLDKKVMDKNQIQIHLPPRKDPGVLFEKETVSKHLFFGEIFYFRIREVLMKGFNYFN